MAPWISKRDPNLCQDCQYCRKWGCRYGSCISMEEVERIGKEIPDIDPNLQVCLLDYRPEFRRGLIEGKVIQRPSYQEMLEVCHLLRGADLPTVLCQTPFGHIGPHIPDKRR